MPNLLDIRRRIRSVKNTRQITKAMKMVSAAKLRRAQEQALAARPYAAQLRALLQDMVARTDLATLGEDPAGQAVSRLLVRRPEKRILLITIGSDKGLAGAFSAQVIKAALTFMAEHPGTEVKLELVGRRVRDHFRRQPELIAGQYLNAFGRTVDYGVAREIAADVIHRYSTGETDAVYLLGNEFKSVIQQRVVLHQLLPFSASPAKESAKGGQAAGQEAAQADYLLEEPPAELLSELVPRYLQVQIYRSLLESFAAEHAARMNAMDSASRNAGDLIDSLTLTMNRVRQAAITKEIIEIVSGAAALES